MHAIAWGKIKCLFKKVQSYLSTSHNFFCEKGTHHFQTKGVGEIVNFSSKLLDIFLAPFEQSSNWEDKNTPAKNTSNAFPMDWWTTEDFGTQNERDMNELTKWREFLF